MLDPQKTDDLFFFGGISTNRLTEFNRTNTVILKWEVNEVNGIPSGFFQGGCLVTFRVPKVFWHTVVGGDIWWLVVGRSRQNTNTLW